MMKLVLVTTSDLYKNRDLEGVLNADSRMPLRDAYIVRSSGFVAKDSV